jgi:hypothetical protein
MNALASAFDPELCVHLDPGGIMPVDRNWSFADSQYDSPPAGASDPPCDAVIIRVADLPDTLLAWQQPGYVNATHPAGETYGANTRGAHDAHGIYLERAGKRLFAVGSPLIASLPATIALPDVACDALPDLDGGRPADGALDAGAAP